MDQENRKFPLIKISEIRAHPENFRLLERVPEPDVSSLPLHIYNPLPDERTDTLIFLDTETTGLDFSRHKIIELAMIRCTYSVDRQIILSVDDVYDEFEDPKEPLDPEIVAITGITDEMVKDKKFDKSRIAEMLREDPLIIAHNAGFDRPFFDRRFGRVKEFASLRWACSLQEIDWTLHGYPSAKLEYLLAAEGFFYEAHRAVTDCFALGFLMQIKGEYFKELLDSADLYAYRVSVSGSVPVAVVDELKRRSFKWDGRNKEWYISLQSAEEADKTVAYLSSITSYSSNAEQNQLNRTVRRYSSRERYRISNSKGE